MIEFINQFLDQPGYSSCLLVVNSDSGRLKVANKLLQNHCTGQVDVNKELSSVLLNVQPGKRPRFIQQWTQRIIEERMPGPVLFTNIDLLFEPSLGLDPLQLFRGLGRRAKLVVMWPGEFDGANLSYAVPRHDHYRTWQNPDVQIRQLQ